MFEVGVVSDLYKVGITEDGEEAVSECYYVQIEAKDGRRWVHNISYPGSEVKYHEEEGFAYFPDNREEASAAAEAFAATVRAQVEGGGTVDLEEWQEDRPRYGSKPFQDLDDAGVFRDQEREAQYY